MYHHITDRERDLIALWHGQGLSVRSIAKKLKRSPATISRELRRNKSLISSQYVAIAAQRRAGTRAVESRRRHPLKHPWVYGAVIDRLRRGWSPEQISGRLKLKHGHPVVCPETIYRFIYSDKNTDKHLWEFLPGKQKKRRKQNGRSVKRIRIPQRVSVHDRPAVIDNRSEFGHWEGDTVEGRKSDGDGIHTEVERVTRYLFAGKVDRIAGSETIGVQRQMFSGLPPAVRRSTTLDNGRENYSHLVLRFLGMKTFFTDPYAAWQKGTNENTNGLLRRYLPKGTSFRDLTQDELDDIVWEINNRPKKCLGYNTPREEFEKWLKCCT